MTDWKNLNVEIAKGMHEGEPVGRYQHVREAGLLCSGILSSLTILLESETDREIRYLALDWLTQMTFHLQHAKEIALDLQKQPIPQDVPGIKLHAREQFCISGFLRALADFRGDAQPP